MVRIYQGDRIGVVVSMGEKSCRGSDGDQYETRVGGPRVGNEIQI